MKGSANLEGGFTLIELMVVILIIGLLATIVVQNLKGATDKAKKIKAQADISALKTALDRYYLDNDRILPAIRVCRAGQRTTKRQGSRRLPAGRLYRDGSRTIRGAMGTSIRAMATITC